MSTLLYRTGWVLVGVIVISASFFITLRVLDYRNSESAQQTAANPPPAKTDDGPSRTDVARARAEGPSNVGVSPTRAGTPAANTVFALDIRSGANNWAVPSTRTRVELTPAGLMLASTEAPGAHQFRTAGISTVKGQTYTVNYNITVSQGALTLAVADLTTQQIAKSSAISKGAGSLTFTAQSNSSQVVLYSSDAAQSTASVASITVTAQ